MRIAIIFIPNVDSLLITGSAVVPFVPAVAPTKDCPVFISAPVVPVDFLKIYNLGVALLSTKNTCASESGFKAMAPIYFDNVLALAPGLVQLVVFCPFSHCFTPCKDELASLV